MINRVWDLFQFIRSRRAHLLISRRFFAVAASILLASIMLASCGGGTNVSRSSFVPGVPSSAGSSVAERPYAVEDCTYWYQEATPGVEDPATDTLLGYWCTGNDSGTGTGYVCTGRCYSSTTLPNPPTTTRAQKILANAQKLLGTKTRAIAKKIGGTACAYMVNQATGFGFSDWVPTMVQQMNDDTSEFTQLTPNSSGLFPQAQPGDIIVEDGTDYADAEDPYSPAQSHVGICANDGCTQIYSNSDSQGQFMNNFHDGPNIGGYQATIYHVNG